MKKISIRVLALCLVVLVLSAALASCGKTLSGIYECNTFGIVVTYVFSGKEFTRSIKGLTPNDMGVTESGTYRIENGTIVVAGNAAQVQIIIDSVVFYRALVRHLH